VSHQCPAHAIFLKAKIHIKISGEQNVKLDEDRMSITGGFQGLGLRYC
jgi:hypothetical protein